ncbi:MAG: thioredoxin family protein [Polyangiaceae bacterium]
MSDAKSVTFVNELNFETEVLGSKLPVLIDVSATWCGPCKLARPVVADLATTHQGALKVVEIDGDESPELVARLGVRGFPTFLGVVGGQIVDRRAGFGGKRPLEEMANALVKGGASAAAV